jgi:hypothetical protein
MRICPWRLACQGKVLKERSLMTYDFRMGMDDVRNAFTRESLFTETALDVAQNLLMGRV